jgi:hypothetical protein
MRGSGYVSDIVVTPVVRRRWPVRELAILGPLLGAVWITADVSFATLLVASAVGLVLALLWVLVVLIQIRHAAFGIRGGELFYVGVLGRRLVARVSEDVLVSRVPRNDRPDTYWQVWEGPERGITLTEEAWGRDALAEVARVWGATVREEPTPTSITELGRRHPTATPWIARHAYAIPIAAFALVAIAIAAVLLGSAT